MKLKQVINQIKIDEFGRPSGILALAKQAGDSAHDLVDQTRKRLGTRKVGHAGALDVFATGLMLILVGKATKLADKLLDLDKEYKADILLGIATDTQDIEGTITNVDANFASLNDAELKDALANFKGEQEQYVSLYSSVKVGGKKLRVLMRDERYEKIKKLSDSGHKQLEFIPNNLESSLQPFVIEIPRKHIHIYDIELLANEIVSGAKFEFLAARHELASKKWQHVQIRVRCSKGTYIRQLAEDIGSYLGTSAMLSALERTAIADIKLNDAIDLSSLTTQSAR